MQRKAILFIDADNAPSNSKNVPKVLRNFAAVTGYSVSRAFIAANNSANIDTWVTNIRRRHPDASINTAKTATSKDSADGYHDDVDQSMLFVMLQAGVGDGNKVLGYRWCYVVVFVLVHKKYPY